MDEKTVTFNEDQLDLLQLALQYAYEDADNDDDAMAYKELATHIGVEING
jgi:hypothetical protein